MVHGTAGRSLLVPRLGELVDNISHPALHVAVVGVPGSGAAEVAGAVADATLARVLRQPAPLPHDARLADWMAALASWGGTLAADRVTPSPGEMLPEPGPVATVADCWLGTLLVAAEARLAAADAGAFVGHFPDVARTTVAPSVALVTVASAATLAERIAFRARLGDHTDLFRDAVAPVTGATPEAIAADLVALQQRLLERITRRGTDDDPLRPLRPPAVVVVPADDLGAAITEGLAAVEAMT